MILRLLTSATCLLALFFIVVAHFLGSALIKTSLFVRCAFFNAAGGILGCLCVGAAGYREATGEHENSRGDPHRMIRKQAPKPPARFDLSLGIARSPRADFYHGVSS